MKTNKGRMALAAASLVLLLGLAGCGDRVDDSATPQAARTSLELDRPSVQSASEPAATADANATAQRGAAPAAAEDPDARISNDVKSALVADPAIGTSTKIDVYSDEGAVTLRGQALDPQARERATELAKGVTGVKSVDNQLTLG